jgi:hypothetical protein
MKDKREDKKKQEVKDSGQGKEGKKYLPVLWKKRKIGIPVFAAAAFGIILLAVFAGKPPSEQREPVTESAEPKEVRQEPENTPVSVKPQEKKEPEEQREDPVKTEETKEELPDTDPAEEEENPVSQAEPTPSPPEVQTPSAPKAEVQEEIVQVQPETPVSPSLESQPEAPPSHTHHWVEETENIYHDAVTESVYVVDQAAYEEPVYEEVPVYETYGVEICGVCGAELYSAEEVSAHSETHIDWETLENPFYYYTDWRKRQVGTERVQTGTIHHDEEGHYEEQVVQAAYTETVITGYRCSGCGEYRSA